MEKHYKMTPKQIQLMKNYGKALEAISEECMDDVDGHFNNELSMMPFWPMSIDEMAAEVYNWTGKNGFDADRDDIEWTDANGVKYDAAGEPIREDENKKDETASVHQKRLTK